MPIATGRSPSTRMMTGVDQGEIKSLERHVDEACVSFYMPLDDAAQRDGQGPNRLRALIDQAAELLHAAGALEPAQVAPLLQPAVALSEDTEFWQQGHSGIAAFAAKDYFSVFPLAYRPPELVLAGTRFHLKPILPALACNSTFYLLAFSRLNVRLYRVTRDAWQNLPEAFLEGGALDADSSEPTAGLEHARTKDKHKLVDYIRGVERRVRAALKGQNDPLIVATVSENYHIYRKINRYPFLLKEFVFGNPDPKSAQQLCAEATPIVQKHYEKRAILARHTVQAALDLGGLATCDIDEAIDASEQGRIETCIIASDEPAWGKIQCNGFSLAVETDDGRADLSRIDLLDYLAVRTLKAGGEVYLAPSDQVPGKAKLAALFRY